MKPTIAVDIDEVLAQHNIALIEYYNSTYGTNHVFDDYISDRWSDIWGLTHEETERRAIAFHETGLHGRFPVLPGAQPAIQQLAQDYRLIALTVRRRMTIQWTHDWIDMHFPDLFSDVRFVHAWEDPLAPSKAEVCKEIDAGLLIDDTPKHCLLAADAGVDAILFGDYPWNQVEALPPGVRRCANWQEVLDYLHESRDR